MSKIDKYIDKFKNALKKENLNFTEQRYAVLKILFENDGHYDCEEIVQLISKKKIKTSRATVYRTLDILVKYDFARKLVLDDGIARYENKIASSHHDHMICIETGKIIEFYNKKIEDLQDEIAEKKGYEIVKHVHQLFVKPIKK